MYSIWKESPLTALFTLFASGIILFDSHPTFYQTYLVIGLLIIAIVAFATPQRAVLFYTSIVLWIACGYTVTGWHSAQTTITTEKTERVGIVISEPKLTEKAQFATLEILSNENDSLHYAEEILIEGIFLDKSKTLHKDEIIRFHTQLSAIEKTENEFSAYKYRKGIRHKAFIYKWDSCTTRDQAFADKAKLWFNNSITFQIPSKNQAIINGICFGQKSGIEKSDLEHFQQAGFMHLLAVSGMHIGFVSMLFSFIFSKLTTSYKGKRRSKIFIITIIWLYVALVGFTPSALRAGILFTLYFIAELKEKEVSKYQMLAASGLIILIIRPMDIFSISFQLSFCAMLGIIGTMRALKSTLKIKRKLARYFVEAFTIGVGAQLGTLPLCLFYFGYYPTYSLIFSIGAGFLVFGIMILAVICVASYPLGLTKFPAIIMNILTEAFDLLAKWIADLPGAGVSLEINNTETVLLATALIIAGLYYEIRNTNKRWELYR